MFITKKHIPRRAFLRGAGVTLALPLLDSMIPAQTPLSKTGSGCPRPVSPASSFRTAWRRDIGSRTAPSRIRQSRHQGLLTMIMKPLGAVRDQTVILSGLWSKSAEPPPGVTGADHWVAAAYLCANKPKKTTGADIQDGTTIDQIIAQKIGQETLMPSMQLAMEDPGANSSNCGEGYSCAYTNSISWSSPTQPLPMELNPQVVFERLFGDGGTPEERAARREQDRSILDSVTQKLARFRRDLGAGDRAKLDEYTDDIREIERRLDIAKKATGVACPPRASSCRPAYRNRSTST